MIPTKVNRKNKLVRQTIPTGNVACSFIPPLQCTNTGEQLTLRLSLPIAPLRAPETRPVLLVGVTQPPYFLWPPCDGLTPDLIPLSASSLSYSAHASPSAWLFCSNITAKLTKETPYTIFGFRPTQYADSAVFWRAELVSDAGDGGRKKTRSNFYIYYFWRWRKRMSRNTSHHVTSHLIPWDRGRGLQARLCRLSQARH